MKKISFVIVNLPLSLTLWVTENVLPVSKGTVQLIGSGDLQKVRFVEALYVEKTSQEEDDIRQAGIW